MNLVSGTRREEGEGIGRWEGVNQLGVGTGRETTECGELKGSCECRGVRRVRGKREERECECGKKRI